MSVCGLGVVGLARHRVRGDRPMRQIASLLGLVLGFGAGAAAAQEPVTVQSLLREDFDLVATTSPAGGGAGLFLQKKDKFVLLLRQRDARLARGQDPVLQARRMSRRSDFA